MEIGSGMELEWNAKIIHLKCFVILFIDFPWTYKLMINEAPSKNSLMRMLNAGHLNTDSKNGKQNSRNKYTQIICLKRIYRNGTKKRKIDDWL